MAVGASDDLAGKLGEGRVLLPAGLSNTVEPSLSDGVVQFQKLISYVGGNAGRKHVPLTRISE